MEQLGRVLVKISIMKKKLLVFLVSREWQVKNFFLLIKQYKSNNNLDVLFLCSDLITKGNSYEFLKAIQTIMDNK